MIHIIDVVNGSMLTLDMNLALGSVASLQEALEVKTKIPKDKQVLLLNGGEALQPESRVCSYSGAGAGDNSPIFLFNKQAIELINDPNPFTEYGQDSDLRERHQSCMNLAPDPQTILMRCQFADEISKCSENQIIICSQLVHDQHMQHQGWLAVVANLEDSINAFRESWQNLDITFKQFLEQKQAHHDLLVRFPQDLELLSRIPILPELCINLTNSTHGNNSKGTDSVATLLDWINQKNRQNNLHETSEMCIQALNRFGPDSLDDLMKDAQLVISRSEQSEMKEIKGLADRLFALDKKMEELKKLKNEQKDLSESISNNYKTYKRTNDPSIIPDLCRSHETQLDIMMKNYQKIREIRRKCVLSKQELSHNIHCRLKWVMGVEKQQAEVTEKLIVYRENIRRLKSYMEIVQQIHNAPDLYIKAVAEVIRRKNFSQAYIDFCHLISNDSRSIYYEESKIRREFINALSNHFLYTLFGGVTDSLPPFALEPPSIFDDSLPPLEEKHLELVKKSVPELVDKLKLQLELESTHPGQILASYLRKVSSNSSTESQTETDQSKVPCQISQCLYKFDDSTFVNCSAVADSTNSMLNSLKQIRGFLNSLRDEVKGNISTANEVFADMESKTIDIIKSHVEPVRAQLLKEKEELSSQLKIVTSDAENQKNLNETKIEDLQSQLEEANKSNENLKLILLDKEVELNEVRMDKSQQENDYVLLKKKESEMNSLIANLKLESEQVRSNVQLENALLKEEVDKLKMQLQNVTQKKEKEMRELIDNEVFNALKAQRERLAAEHKLEMETLRSRFRLASSIERAQDPLSPESITAEQFKTEISDLKSALEAKEGEITQLKQAHEDEIQALKQVQYNEAVNRIRNEKDQVISVYKDKVDQLTNQLEEEKKKSLAAIQEKTSARIGQVPRFAPSAHFNDKVAILSCEVDDLVLFCFAPKYQSYIVFSLNPTLHFLHSDSSDAITKNSSPGDSTNSWCLAVVIDKEYCQAKKAQNRYNVPVGTKFYHVRARPWIPSEEKRRLTTSVSVSSSLSQSATTASASLERRTSSSVSEDKSESTTTTGMSTSLYPKIP